MSNPHADFSLPTDAGTDLPPVTSVSTPPTSAPIPAQAATDGNIMKPDEWDIHIAAELTVLRTENAALSSQVEDVVRDVSDMRVANSELTTQVSDMRVTNSELTTQVSDMRVTNSELTGELSDMRVANAILTAQVSDLRAGNSTLTGELWDMRVANATLTSHVSDLRVSNSTFTAQISDLRAANSALSDEVSDLRVVVRDLLSSNAALTAQVQNLLSANTALNADVTALRSSNAALSNRATDLTNANAVLTGQVRDLRGENEAVQRNLTTLAITIGDIKKARREARLQIAAAERQYKSRLMKLAAMCAIFVATVVCVGYFTDWKSQPSVFISFGVALCAVVTAAEQAYAERIVRDSTMEEVDRLGVSEDNLRRAQ